MISSRDFHDFAFRICMKPIRNGYLYIDSGFNYTIPGETSSMSRIYTTILLVLMITTFCCGQNSFRFRHIGVGDGLSQGSIYHMLKDSRGFLWLASQDGINRFDGKNIEVYLSGATGESTNVQGIAEDSAANLWVGSHKGLYQYLRKKDKFVKPILLNSQGEGSVHVFNDKNKNVYLLSESGLYRIFGNKLKLLSKELLYNRSQFTNFLAESPNGDIWFLDAQKGLKRYVPSTNKISYFFSDKKENISGKPESFSCISFDRGGHLWLGSKNGLIRFDFTQKTVTTFNQIVKVRPYNLLDIAEDKSGFLWLATEGNGILIFDPVGKKLVEHLNHEDDVPNSLRFNEVSKLYIDDNNDVFANSDPQGLDIITAVSSAFNFYTFGKNPQKNLSDYSVRGLAEGADSSIWIGTELGGINRLNPKTNTITHYTMKEGLPANIIRYIYKDYQSQIWVAAISGLSVFKEDKNRFERFPLPIDCEITTILSIATGLLLLTTDKGLFLLDTDSKKIISHSNTNMIGGYSSTVDPNTGLIYLSDRHRGVKVFALKDKQLILKKTLLENFHVMQVYHQTDQPFLWVCTDRGLLKWDNEKNVLIRDYRVKDGLHHEFIYSMLPDFSGNFWLSTNRGLSKFNPGNEKFEFIKDLPPREYNSRASLLTTNGNLYFGSTTGLDLIKPVLLSQKNEHVGVQLTKLTLDEANPDLDSMYLGELNYLRLPFLNNTFSIQFTATDYRSGGLNRYRYFLKNYDEDTIYSGTVNQVRYARLPAGEYEFQLQASDLGGNWVSPVRKLTILIDPPFWQTWWFIASFMIALAYVGFLSIRGYLHYRLHEQRLQSEKQIFLEKERSRIARDINDSLGSELFGLKLLGQVALAKTKNEDDDSYLQKIVDVSKSISEKISEVIWVTDSNQDNTESLWSYIQKNALIYLKPSTITYHFESLPENQTFQVSGERRHEILNFHKQLFSELSKHCNLPHCEVKFNIIENQLVILFHNLELDLMEPSIFANLEKLRGNRIIEQNLQNIFKIPLADQLSPEVHI